MRQGIGSRDKGEGTREKGEGLPYHQKVPSRLRLSGRRVYWLVFI
jgi:hypothetical protein